MSKIDLYKGDLVLFGYQNDMDCLIANAKTIADMLCVENIYIDFDGVPKNSFVIFNRFFAFSDDGGYSWQERYTIMSDSSNILEKRVLRGGILVKGKQGD